MGKKKKTSDSPDKADTGISEQDREYHNGTKEEAGAYNTFTKSITTAKELGSQGLVILPFTPTNSQKTIGWTVWDRKE